MEGGGGGDDQEGAPHPVGFGHVGEEGERLHGLAQAHLIREDPVDALVVQGAQPVHSLQLISLQRSL